MTRNDLEKELARITAQIQGLENEYDQLEFRKIDLENELKSLQAGNKAYIVKLILPAECEFEIIAPNEKSAKDIAYNKILEDYDDEDIIDKTNFDINFDAEISYEIEEIKND